MKLNNILAISGLPGLYELTANRPNGLLVSPLEGGKNKFCPSRKHQFTPLETVAIYTWADTVDLKDVFKTMMEKSADLPLPSHKESNDVLRAYFEEIVPEYDKDRVYPNDIKKVLKWYNSLDGKGYLTAEDPSEEEE